MNEQSREALDSYYAEAASWNRDRVLSVRRSQRLYLWIAIVGVTLAVLEAIALVLMMPLKTVEPYTLMVDRTTGYVQALKPLDRNAIAPDAALTQAFLAQYVIGRESFDAATLNANYRKVALMSGGRTRNAYVQSMQPTNPASPLMLYPRSSVIDARVKSVSPIGKDTAMVRFDTVRTDANGQVQPPAAWVAVVRYQYSTAPMSLEDRFVNPLGFQVTSYRRNPETAPPPTLAQPVPSAAYYPGTPAPRPGVAQ